MPNITIKNSFDFFFLYVNYFCLHIIIIIILIENTYAARVESLVRLPTLLEQALRATVYGRPGGAYIEIPVYFL